MTVVFLFRPETRKHIEEQVDKLRLLSENWHNSCYYSYRKMHIITYPQLEASYA